MCVTSVAKKHRANTRTGTRSVLPPDMICAKSRFSRLPLALYFVPKVQLKDLKGRQ